MKNQNQTGLSCKDCLWGDKCAEDKICDDFSPIAIDLDPNSFEYILRKLKAENVPTQDKYLRRHPVYDSYVHYDKTVTLDDYYVGMINDTLRQIRKGKIAYLYKVEQLKDLLRFEPDACIDFKGGVYYITL